MSLHSSLALSIAMAAAGPATANDVAAAPGATLRALDRLSGQTEDLAVRTGDSERLFGRLRVSLVECRYPVANPSGNAYAYLLIDDAETGSKLFEGWMVADSPALNPFDHMRYDVWVLRCETP